MEAGTEQVEALDRAEAVSPPQAGCGYLVSSSGRGPLLARGFSNVLRIRSSRRIGEAGPVQREFVTLCSGRYGSVGFRAGECTGSVILASFRAWLSSGLTS